MTKTNIRFCIFSLALIVVCTNIFAQNWEAVPLVSQKILNNGHTGGEGCQWPQAIEADKTDGSFLLFGTDVGGIYRSTNGGELWEPCNIGYYPRGNCGFAIDPNNNQRALAVGGNSIANTSHGLYLTTNQAASWKHVLQESDYDGYRNYKDKVEFDARSFNDELGFSTIAYWSNPSGGLYKSEDGGETWSLVNADFGDCVIAVSAENGALFIGNDDGLFKSTDGGVSVDLVLEKAIRDIATVFSNPSKIWVTTSNQLFYSDDNGETLIEIESAEYPNNINAIEISPANVNHLVVWNHEGQYNNPIYSSTNGGITWTKAQFNNTNAFMPNNDRQHKLAWHPVNENKVWSFGGDFITSSSNAGLVFEWDANGYTGILVGGKFNFNIFNPDLLYVASQDYNGAFTKNNGQTWKYCNASGLGWGGFTYGAYAANENVLVTMVSPGWHEPGNLSISTNGGNSFTKTELICNGMEVASGDPKDPNVIYFSEYYSKDLGETWQKMNGCNGVIIANLSGEKEVYGTNGKSVVKSTDLGDNWEMVVEMPGTVLDVAIDPVKQRLFIVTDGNRIFCYDNENLEELTAKIPNDNFDKRSIKAVAVDVNNPNIVFCAGPKNVYKTDASVKRSLDGGETWEILTPNDRTNNGEEIGDGANEVFNVRVNPETRDLWCTGGCYGIWKLIPDNKMTLNISGIKFDSIYKAPQNFKISGEINNNHTSISKVEFFNGDEKLGEVAEAPFEFNWENVEYGDYRIYAIVTDADGNTAFSNVLCPKVRASEIPSVYIISPANKTIFDFNATVEIVTAANDPDGTVTKVEFFNGSEKIGEDSDSVFSINWENVAQGTYEITAKVTDNTNQTVTSKSVTITVRGEGGNLNYLEDFNDGLAQDWLAVSGTWTVTDSQYYHSSTDGIDNCIYHGSTFADYSYSAKIKSEWDNNFGLIFNYQDENNYYFIELDASPSTAKLKRVYNGTTRTLEETTYNGSGNNVFYLVEVINDGSKTTIKVDGETIMEDIPTPEFIYGKIGLYAWWNKIWYEDISVAATTDIPLEETVYTCSNEPYFGFTESGKYLRKGENKYGVETLIITNLTVFSTVEISEDIDICQGERYLDWNESGTYQREFTTLNGCDSIVITRLTVHVNPQKPSIQANADTLTCSEFGTCFWYMNDSLLEDKNTRSIIIQESGNYKVRVTDENGCSSEFSNTVFIVKTNTRSQYAENMLKIYPNPVTESDFFVETTFKQVGSGKIKIYNSTGIIVFTKKLNQNKIQINSFNLGSKGTFIVQLEADNYSQSKKLILN